MTLLAGSPGASANAVDFMVGGQNYSIPVPTLWHAKQTGIFLPPQVIAQVERALEIVAALGVEPGSAEAAVTTKDNLMRACLLGEVPKLVMALRELMTRAGLPPINISPETVRRAAAEHRAAISTQIAAPGDPPIPSLAPPPATDTMDREAAALVPVREPGDTAGDTAGRGPNFPAGV